MMDEQLLAATWPSSVQGPGRLTTVDGPPPPSTVDVLIDNAQFVVVGVVDSVFPAIAIGDGKSLVTDVGLRVTRSLKNPESVTRIVVSQPGGTLDGFTHRVSGVTPMQTGEEYILFLKEPSATAVRVLPSRQGLVRYEITHGGLLRIEGGRVHVPRIGPNTRPSYDGQTAEQIIAEVQALMRQNK
jgi:hypothetical protein